MARPKKTTEPAKTEKKARTKAAEPKKTVKADPITDSEKAVAAKYTVNVGAETWLNVRKGAGKSFALAGKLYKGDAVIVYEVKDGYGRIDDNKWVSMEHLI